MSIAAPVDSVSTSIHDRTPPQAPSRKETELLDTLSRCEEVVVDLLHRACRTLSLPCHLLWSPGHRQYPSRLPHLDLSIHKIQSELKNGRATTIVAKLCSPVADSAAGICLQGFRYQSFIVLSGCRSTRLAVQNVQPRPAFAFSLLEFACRPFYRCRAQKGHLAGISQAGNAHLVERLVHAPKRASQE